MKNDDQLHAVNHAIDFLEALYLDRSASQERNEVLDELTELQAVLVSLGTVKKLDT